LSLAQEFDVDHSILVPLHFLTPHMQLPIVPLFINGVVHPLPAARAASPSGKMVRTAVEALPPAAKVRFWRAAASRSICGHLSPRGQFGRHPGRGLGDTVLGHLQNGRINDLLNEATSERMARAGNVAGELLNWIAMLGVIGDRRPRFLEPQREMGPRLWRVALD